MTASRLPVLLALALALGWAVLVGAWRPGEPAAYGWFVAGQVSGNRLRLPLLRPELVRRSGLTGRGPWPFPGLSVELGWVRMHPWFLADVLRYYVERPEERPGIGTADGYRRLRRTLGLP
ncbi:hypothetical protein ACFY2R_09315 [Micromonospora olivasterospora]|nr:hypothetical protein [Micromonospora olivasterospora]